MHAIIFGSREGRNNYHLRASAALPREPYRKTYDPGELTENQSFNSFFTAYTTAGARSLKS